MTTTDSVDSNLLLELVQMAAISPEDAHRIVDNYRERAKQKHSATSTEELRDIVADKIIARYARYATMVGGASGLVGVVPGIGTIVAATAGATADAAASMKLQLDMCMCLVAAYGYDLTKQDAQYLSFLIAAGGAIEKAGEAAGVRLAAQAGVRLLRQYLRGAALQAIKEMFKKVGIIFTRKALEKALPFGIGVLVGGGANYGLTVFVGRQAKAWLTLDARMPR